MKRTAFIASACAALLIACGKSPGPDGQIACFSAADFNAGSSFGHAIAADSNWIAVAEPEANLVHILHRTDADGWSRAGVLAPPPGSTPLSVGTGFGFALALDGDRLLIASFHRANRPDGPGYVWTDMAGVATHSAVFQADLSSPGAITEITADDGYVVGPAIAAKGGRIALQVRSRDADPDADPGAIEMRGPDGVQRIAAPGPGGAGPVLSLALSADGRLAAGAPRMGQAGGVRVYAPDPATHSDLIAPPGAAVGFSTSLSGDRIVLGGGAFGFAAPRALLIGPDGDMTDLPGGGAAAMQGDRLLLAQASSRDGERQARAALWSLGADGPEMIRDWPGAFAAAFAGDDIVLMMDEAERRVCVLETTP